MQNTAMPGEHKRQLSAKAAVSARDRVFYAVNNALLFLVLVLVVIPIWNVTVCSLSSGDAVAAGRVGFWPVDFSFEGYAAVFKDKYILSGYGNTFLYTLAGTLVNLVMTVLIAYPLSRNDVPGRNFVMSLFAATMIFNGGMIPTYLNLRDLNLLNTRWVMILPGAISVYNMIICRTFFKTNLPREMLEAAQIDGCGEFRYFLSVALPLSKAVIAVIALYYAVSHWNAFFSAFLYLNDRELFPLQIVLRDILIANRVDASVIADSDSMLQLNLVETLKYSLIMVSCVPIWCVYPFVQKFFVQGVMIGAIKG